MSDYFANSRFVSNDMSSEFYQPQSILQDDAHVFTCTQLENLMYDEIGSWEESQVTPVNPDLGQNFNSSMSCMSAYTMGDPTTSSSVVPVAPPDLPVPSAENLGEMNSRQFISFIKIHDNGQRNLLIPQVNANGTRSLLSFSLVGLDNFDPSSMITIPNPHVTPSSPVTDDENDVVIKQLTTEEDMEWLENQLKSKETGEKVRKKLTRMIIQEGGKTSRAHIRNALKLLLHTRLAAKYNWKGTKRNGIKGKLKFEKLALCSILTGCLLQKYPEETKKKMEDVIKEWLKSAGTAAKKLS